MEVINMNTTLIVYEKRAQTDEICKLIGQVLGPSVCVEPQEYNGQFDGHSEVVLVFTLDEGKIPPRTARFIEDNVAQLQQKRVALVCLSGNRSAAGHALRSAKRKFSGRVAVSVRIPIVTRPKADAEIHNRANSGESAEKLIAMKRVLYDMPEMPHDTLVERVMQVLQSHNTCALCTGHDGGVRATPIEYVYRNTALYFLSEGGEKFAHMYANPRVCAAIFDAYSGFDKLEGVQIEGNAVMVKTFCAEYNDIIESKGLSADNLRKLPVELTMFKLVPERIEILESGFAKAGYAAKQVLTKKPFPYSNSI
jgi:hypothetical protein